MRFNTPWSRSRARLAARLEKVAVMIPYAKMPGTKKVVNETLPRSAMRWPLDRAPKMTSSMSGMTKLKNARLRLRQNERCS